MITKIIFLSNKALLMGPFGFLKNYMWIGGINILTSRPKVLVIWWQMRLRAQNGTADIRNLVLGCEIAV